MRIFNFLQFVSLAATAQGSLRNVGSAEEDWSVSIVESTISRSTPQKIGPWGYTTGLYLLAQYQVYKRTNESRYLDYIQEWADRYVNSDGHLNDSLGSLDSMQAGNILIALYTETGDTRYKTAASQIRNRLDTYPRTYDGGLWHFISYGPELWADGTFMVNPFLIRYGVAFDDSEYVYNETSTQIIVFGDHLQVENGLLQHAYDESRTEKWADAESGRSEEQWCRAMGWYGMAMTDVLELLPEDHPNRPGVLEKLYKFVEGVATYQDEESGRWFQVVNKADLEDNWTETSCSAMFTNTVLTSLNRGYIEDDNGRYSELVDKGLSGVLERVRKNDKGLTDIFEICVGTNVGDLAFYLDRPRRTNDLHGLGAVILMLEQATHWNSTK
jgi:unsaturated rhamnogalacturonyl hydrolase